MIATQDLDCLDRAKFHYALPLPIGPAFLDSFVDCDVQVHAFSRFSPLARDLFTITWGGQFRCDGIVGGDELVVAFAGDAIAWPVATMRDFDARLAKLGFGVVEYRRGTDLGCATCPARFAKRCRGLETSGHPGEGRGSVAQVEMTTHSARRSVSRNRAGAAGGVV